MHIAGSGSVSHPSTPPSPPPQGPLNSLIAQPGIALTQMQDLTPDLVGLPEVSQAHLSSLSRSSCMVSLLSRVSTRLLGLVSPTNLLTLH